MRLSLLALAVALAVPASAQIAVGDTPVVLDFNAFRGTGFAPTPAAGQLDSDNFDVIGDAGPAANRASTFGDTQADGAFARGTSTGGVTAEGVYAFETAAGDFALGIQPTTSFFGPGSSGGSGGYIHVRYQNATNRTLTAVEVRGEAKILNNGARSTSIGVSLVPDVVVTNGQEVSRGPSGSVVLRIDTPGAATQAGWATQPFSATVTASRDANGNSVPLEISPGENFYVRVFVSDNPDGPTSGDRDEFGIDNLSVVAASGVSTETGAGAGGVTVRPVYPNPVASSASARVAVTTPAAERVSVRVFDAVGRLVATAYDGPTAAGAETVVALPSALAPGTYLVRVTGETFAQNRLVTVVR